MLTRDIANHRLKIRDDILYQESNYKMSKKYNVITTKNIIEQFENNGFYIADMTQSSTRKKERDSFQKHIVKMRNNKIAPKVNDYIPEVVIQNSYDGTSSLAIYFGIYRLVCLNGLIVGDSIIKPIKIRHVGINAFNINEYIASFAQNISKVTNIVKNMKEIDLTDKMKEDFIRLAFRVRKEKDITKIIQPEQIITPQREEDKVPNLWNIYNIVQEKVINGDYYKFSTYTKKGLVEQIERKAKPISSLTRRVELNQILFDHAVSYI